MFTLIILCFPYVNNPPHTCFLSVPHYCKLIYWPNNGASKLILNIVIQGLRLLFCSFLSSSSFLYCIAFRFFAIKSYFKFYLFYWIFSLQNESFAICHASKLLLFSPSWHLSVFLFLRWNHMCTFVSGMGRSEDCLLPVYIDEEFLLIS